MALKVYDFGCAACNFILYNQTVSENDIIPCPICEVAMQRQMPAPQTLTTIVPTYPGSAKYKAGYVHKYGNRPAEKTQIGYGGSVSKDHPTGGGKPQN